MIFFPSLISKYPYEDTVIIEYNNIYNNIFIIYENERFSDLSNIDNEQIKNYFILIPFKKENDKYFLLGYIQQSSFYLDCYNIKYEDSLKLIIKILLILI